MEFKKCVRCGSFFVTEGEVCQNCMPKDKFEMGQVRDYLENNLGNNTAHNISMNTGISTKNINRYLNNL